MQATRPTPPSFVYTVAADGCWSWDGYCDSNGYARIYDRDAKRIEWAHRWSYRHHKGPIPPRHEIDHTCQNTRCVNPAHLDAVTKAEHVRRTMRRLGKDDLHAAAARLRAAGLTYQEIAGALRYSGREAAFAAVNSAIAKGLIGADEIPRAAYLGDDDRADIAAMVALGIPQVVVAEFYGLHSSQVSRISRGITSGHKESA